MPLGFDSSPSNEPTVDLRADQKGASPPLAPPRKSCDGFDIAPRCYLGAKGMSVAEGYRDKEVLVFVIVQENVAGINKLGVVQSEAMSHASGI